MQIINNSLKTVVICIGCRNRSPVKICSIIYFNIFCGKSHGHAKKSMTRGGAEPPVRSSNLKLTSIGSAANLSPFKISEPPHHLIFKTLVTLLHVHHNKTSQTSGSLRSTIIQPSRNSFYKQPEGASHILCAGMSQSLLNHMWILPTILPSKRVFLVLLNAKTNKLLGAPTLDPHPRHQGCEISYTESLAVKMVQIENSLQNNMWIIPS